MQIVVEIDMNEGKKVKQRLHALIRNNASTKFYETVIHIYRRMYWEAVGNYPTARSRIFQSDLTALAKIHMTDKWGDEWGAHRYTPIYDRHFRNLRKRKLKILEIGIGGFEDPHAGGASLRMWKYYFPKSSIYSIDVLDKSAIQEHRIKVFQGSQNDPDFLRYVVGQMGGLNIVVDDGSHVNEHVITSFKALFPLLAEGGIYAIEDTQTSYWPKYGGDSYNLNNPNTIMNFLKTLTDGLNHEEIQRKDYKPTYFDQNIVSLHFYHNLVIIHKGRNEEGESLYK